jgi:DNA-binding FrmR family transcriptional regulator
MLKPDSFANRHSERLQMQIEPTDLKAARDRLVRVQGQIGGIVKMLDEGRDCTEILTQLAAANTALTRAGFTIIATGMAQCKDDETGLANRAKLEKAFMSLA